MQVRCRYVFDDYLAISEAARRLAIARDAHVLVVATVIGIREIEQMICSKLRMQRDAHQTAFATRLGVGNGEQRRRTQLSVFVDAHTARPLSKDHSAIRRPDNRPWHFQIAYDGFNFEAGLRAE